MVWRAMWSLSLTIAIVLFMVEAFVALETESTTDDEGMQHLFDWLGLIRID